MFKHTHSKILAKRYSRAFQNLFNHVQLESLKNDLKNLYKMFELFLNKDKIARLKISNSITQLNLLSQIIKEEKFDKNIHNFCKVLALNKRLYLLPQIIEELLTKIDLLNNIIIAEVVSVDKLNDQEVNLISSKLKQISGKEVQIKTKIDNKILGGLIITMGSKMFDDSLVSKFKKLEKSFT